MDSKALHIFESFKEDILSLRLHQSKTNGPALKKPLLLLYLISKIEKGEFKRNKVLFVEIEKELSDLIMNYGGRASGARPEQPFHHLSSSKIWNLNLPKGVNNYFNKTLNIKILRDSETFGYLNQEYYNLLIKYPEARAKISDIILKAWWPETVGEEIKMFLEIPDIKEPTVIRKAGYSNFVRATLSNYRYRCAVCGFDALINKLPFGLDAAHIMWKTHGGPDEIHNGLALCKIHHWGFDRGVITINHSLLRIRVSSFFVARDKYSIQQFEQLDGSNLQSFINCPPSERYLKWHEKYIFIQ